MPKPLLPFEDLKFLPCMLTVNFATFYVLKCPQIKLHVKLLMLQKIMCNINRKHMSKVSGQNAKRGYL